MHEANAGGPSRRTVLGGLAAGAGLAAVSAFVAGCDSKGGKNAGAGPGSSAPASDQSAQDGSDVNSAKAQAVEKLALQVVATAPVKDAVERGMKTFAASEDAKKPDAMRYARSALDETAMLASLNAAMGAVPDPVWVWVYAAPRKWNGYTMPGTRWYADNADTFYRTVRVQDTSSYEITIRPAEKLPAQLTFMLWDWMMFENGINEQSDIPLGTFAITEATPRNADGSITLTAGPESADGSPNHLQLKPGTKQIFCREIRGDWSIPAVGLSVKRTKGPAQPPKTLDELAQEAVTYIDAGVPGTLKITLTFGELFENQLAPIRVRWAEGAKDQKMEPDEPIGPDKAVGFISSALFNLKEDEALVMTLNMLGTEYLSVNTYRPWLVSPEHVYGTSSLNNFQANPNPDGSFTFVLARKDPQVYNWLDVGGIPYGEIAVRWQKLTRPVLPTLKDAAPLVKVVTLGDLKEVLPPTTKFVTPEERQGQRDTRAKNYELRCLGTPCEVGGDLDKPY